MMSSTWTHNKRLRVYVWREKCVWFWQHALVAGFAQHNLRCRSAWTEWCELRKMCQSAMASQAPLAAAVAAAGATAEAGLTTVHSTENEAKCAVQRERWESWQRYRYHADMLHDRARNEAYAAALKVPAMACITCMPAASHTRPVGNCHTGGGSSSKDERWSCTMCSGHWDWVRPAGTACCKNRRICGRGCS